MLILTSPEYSSIRNVSRLSRVGDSVHSTGGYATDYDVVFAQTWVDYMDYTGVLQDYKPAYLDIVVTRGEGTMAPEPAEYDTYFAVYSAYEVLLGGGYMDLRAGPYTLRVNINWAALDPSDHIWRMTFGNQAHYSWPFTAMVTGPDLYPPFWTDFILTVETTT